MWKEFNLINSFTLECSFCGPTSGLYKDCHFTISLMKDMGRVFCLSLMDYASKEYKVKEAIAELEQLFPLQKAEESNAFSDKQDNKNDNTGNNRNGGQFNSYFGGDQGDDDQNNDDKNTK